MREKHQSGSTGLLWTLTVSSVAADRRGSKRKVRGIRISHQHFSARTVGISKLSRNRHCVCKAGRCPVSKSEVRWAGAVKLVDDLAGESPASANCPVGTVDISGDKAGD